MKSNRRPARKTPNASLALFAQAADDAALCSAPHGFHPAVQAWLTRTFGEATQAQREAWPQIAAGQHVLIAAPTGSGKTLAGFLAAIDALVKRAVTEGLPDETAVVYVSPLKALSNDIQRNLEWPLEAISAELRQRDHAEVTIRTMVRTGDTPQSARQLMRRRPPHILVTTPESLYILLGSESGREMLSTTRSVIVDEIHALAPDKRGAHLALSLERLEALTLGRLETLTQRPLQRIGISATQKPIERVAKFLLGDRGDCRIVDVGYTRKRDLAIEVPPMPLSAVMSSEVWQMVHGRIAELALQHRTTLVFVNTRRMAERLARHLSERLGENLVAAHHGSLAKEHRLEAEQKLKRGELKVMVATASLELGIDIGDVELVCQLNSPRAIAAFLQRVGRSGHSLNGVPKGRLFPTSRDDLVECVALLDSVRRGELDALEIMPKPMDVLAQHIAAEVACRDCGEDELYQQYKRAQPYAELSLDEYREVVRMLADGFSTRRGQSSVLIHRDAVNGQLRARRGTRLTTITNGGVIPDTADYEVILEPAAQFVGTVNEDFAIESLAGDIFQLGNHSYRILRVERGKMRVEDAHGLSPTIPFWLGEAPGRSDELSFAVSRLREEVAARMHNSEEALQWLQQEVGAAPSAAQQLLEYLYVGATGLGVMPTQNQVVLERFFDESGGMQLVIHAPFGSRINRAWGLALRKRFCRSFNFELQAAAIEDAIVLSLSTSHSFPLEEVSRYLHSASAREVLIQALLAAPMFGLRWRWVAGVALALLRFRSGKKVPAQFQRMDAEDLIAAVFPDQIACAENVVGEREIPDHPLVNQTIGDCLHEAMDVDGLIRVLKRMESGEIQVVARDTTEASQFAQEILNARPYAFLDDAPLEERRTQAVVSRRWQDASTAEDLGKLDQAAIDHVREEAWPRAQDADEMHDALMSLAFITEEEARSNLGWQRSLEELTLAKRATRIGPSSDRSEPVEGPELVERPAVIDGVGGSRAGPTRQPTLAKRRVGPALQVSAQASNAPQLSRTLSDEAISVQGERVEESDRNTPKLWVAAERLPQFQALWPSVSLEPLITAPGEFAAKAWEPDAALREIVRGRLQGLGPVTAAQLAQASGVAQRDIDIALIGLQTEGFVLQGRFEVHVADEQWCERRLLARVHRYTVNRLRSEIEPVAAKDFLRFLFKWQRVGAKESGSGPDAVAAVIAQLEGFQAAASAWEADILPARVADYDFTWLDNLSLVGRVVWMRMNSPQAAATSGPVRATPIVLLPRRNTSLWRQLSRNIAQAPRLSSSAQAPQLSSRAQAVAEYLRSHGACFFEQLGEGTGLLHTQLEEALGELTSAGQVNADGFSGLRALLVPSEKRKPIAGGKRRRRTALFGIEDAGRWALLQREPSVAPLGDADYADVVEHVARTLLKRYGVVFWKLLEREADWLPPWRDLVRCLRRLEARGEVRGGRFVQGVTSEQYALPDAVAALRQARREPEKSDVVVVSGADPLNVIGSVVAGAKVPALAGNRIAYRDGVPIATLIGGQVEFLVSANAEEQWQWRNLLLRRAMPGALASYLGS